MPMPDNRPKIAVIGSGISGIASAYLLDKRYDVTLYESGDYLGGHTNTITVTDGAHFVPIDTGFIVFNKQNYPLLTQFLDQLSIDYTASDMAFGFHDSVRSFWYSSDRPWGIFSQKKNIISPRYWQFLADIRRFNQHVRADLNTGVLDTQALGEYIATLPVSQLLKDAYLLPMGAAIWSCPIEQILAFPAKAFFEFWNNHDLLTLGKRPQWQTISGGAKQYITAFLSRFSGSVHISTPVRAVQRSPRHCTVYTESGAHDFDYCIIATHADQALNLLQRPTNREKRLLSPWQYSTNTAYLHQDKRFMPPKRSAWASWLVQKNHNSMAMTYYMNRLQPLHTKQDYFVTLTPDPVTTTPVIKTAVYTHPVFTAAACETQSELATLNSGSVRFCGSYFGYGFHEDGIRSAVATCRDLGCTL